MLNFVILKKSGHHITNTFASHLSRRIELKLEGWVGVRDAGGSQRAKHTVRVKEVDSNQRANR